MISSSIRYSLSRSACDWIAYRPAANPTMPAMTNSGIEMPLRPSFRLMPSPVSPVSYVVRKA